MSQYDELMDLVITEDTIEEYKERRALQEGTIGNIVKTILGGIALVTIGPYIALLPIAIILAIVSKIQGKKKDKIFNQLNNTPEFKTNVDKLIKEIQTNLSKETKYSKYLVSNQFQTLNKDTADLVNDYKCLVINNIISYDIEKVWKDNLNMSSWDYNNERNDNPDYCVPAPKIIKDITKDIITAIKKINKNTNNKFEIDFYENTDDNIFYYEAYFGTPGKTQPINLYIKIENVKEVDEYFKNNKK